MEHAVQGCEECTKRECTGASREVEQLSKKLDQELPLHIWSLVAVFWPAVIFGRW